MGSAGVGALIAHGAFWVLLGIGFTSRQRRAATGTIFVLLWLAGFVGLRYLTRGTLFFAPYVAILVGTGVRCLQG